MRRLLAFLAALLYAAPVFAQSQLPPAIPQIRANPPGARLAQGFPAVNPATLRDPLPTDSDALGYAVGNMWLNTQNGRLFTALSVTGTGIWVPLALGPKLPFDGYSPAPILVIGTKRMLSSYTGDAFILTRASDSTTLSVGFLQDNNVDVAAADSFCYNTVCSFTTVYNQANPACNATGVVGTAPVWDPIHQLNGTRVISFESVLDTITGGGPTQVAQYLSVGVCLSWEAGANSTWLMAAMVNNSMSRVDDFAILSSADGTVGWGNTRDGTSGGSGIYGLGTGPFGGQVELALPTSPGVTLVSTGANFWYAFSNNQAAITSHTAVAGAKSGAVIGSIGALTKGAVMHVGAFAIWDSALSAAVSSVPNSIIAPVEQAFNIPRQSDTIIAAIGASDTSGKSSITGGSWPYYMQSGITPGATIYNLGSSGLSWPVAISEIDKFMGALYRSTGGATKRNFVVPLTIGGNDIATGATFAEMVAYAQTYTQLAKAYGTNVRIILGQALFRCGFTVGGPAATTLQEWNEWIKSGQAMKSAAEGGAGVDGVALRFENPLISTQTYEAPVKMCNSNISWDGTHLRDDVPAVGSATAGHEYQQSTIWSYVPAINAQMK